MAQVAILSAEAAGHLLPMGGLAAELKRRGHQVTLIGLPRAAPLARQLDLPLLELHDEPVAATRAGRLKAFGARLVGLRWAIQLYHRFHWKSELLLRQAPSLLRDLRPDLLLVDQMLVAGGSVAEHLGVPYVSVCTAVPWNAEPTIPPQITGWSWNPNAWGRFRNGVAYFAWGRYTRPILRRINEYRKQWDLRPLTSLDDTYSPYAELAQLCPELDYPRQQLPETCHYIGSLATHRPRGNDNFPWERLDGRPLVYGSLGTVRASSPRLFQKMAEACAGLDVQLVLALGRWNDRTGYLPEELGALPGAPIVVEYAPQLALLEKAAAMITHCGQNTTLEALSQGVPMVGLPNNVDQPGMAERVAHAGAGLRLSHRRFTVAQLRHSLHRLLTEPTFRQNAERLGKALAAAGGAPRGADIVERVLATGAPVRRGEI